MVLSPVIAKATTLVAFGTIPVLATLLRMIGLYIDGSGPTHHQLSSRRPHQLLRVLQQFNDPRQRQRCRCPIHNPVIARQ